LTVLGSLAACEKQQFNPIPSAPEKSIGPTEKAQYKRRASCRIYDSKDRMVARGSQCTGAGTQCESSSPCKATNLSTGDELMFENMTYDQFVATWNSDQGRTYLESKGCYSKIDE
jgi:coenzyme F420-reducing hydrogenase gamma subunit